MTSEGETRLRTTNVLAVVVTDWEFCVGTFLVAIVHDADITAAEDRPFIRIVGNRKLGKIQVEFFAHIQRKDEGLQ